MTARFLAFIALFTVVFGSAPAWSADGKKVIKVGVVVDGESDRYKAIGEKLTQEIGSLIGKDYQLEVAPEKRRSANFSAPEVSAQVTALLDDPQVDLVVAYGFVASNEIVLRQTLKKPCVAPFVLDQQLQGLSSETTAQRKNLSAVVWSLEIERDLKHLSTLGAGKKVALVIAEPILSSIPALGEDLAKRANAAGFEAVVVPGKATAADTLAALPKDVQSVYFGPNPQMSDEERTAFAAGATKRKLASFSWFGQDDVRRGFLAGIGADSDVQALARRVALNVSNLLEGTDTGRPVTAFKQSEQLFVNADTARQLALSPSSEVLIGAAVVGQGPAGSTTKLTLLRAVQEAMKANPNIAAAQAGVKVLDEQSNRARSPLLPQASLSIGGDWIDADRAGFVPERNINWSGEFTQSVYNQESWADFGIAKDNVRAEEFARDTVELDIASLVARTYVGLLSAQTRVRIQEANLELTQSNLALARVRFRVGTARKSEVYRWESQIARNRADVINAHADQNQLEVALNTLMSRPGESPLSIEDTTLSNSSLLTSDKTFSEYMTNQRQFEIMRGFMVEEAKRNAPELKRADAQLSATDGRIGRSERAFWLPNLGVSGGFEHRFAKDGVGATPATVPGLPPRNDVDWQLGFSATLPILEGGGRLAEVDQAYAEQTQITFQKKSRALAIEQEVRNALYSAAATYANIDLSKAAAEAARGNLEIVQDSYSRGASSIVELIDAQNQSISAELSAAEAVYAFIAQLIRVERAQGRFGFFLSDSQRSEFFQRLKQYTGSASAPAAAQ